MKTNRWIGWVAVLLLALLAGGGIVWVMRSQKAQQAVAQKAATNEPNMAVGTTRAHYTDLQRTLKVTGTVSAVDPLTVGPELSGLRVTEVLVEQGDHVKRGQVMARLNSSVLQAQLDQALAREASATAQVSRARTPNRPQELTTQQATVTQAEATLAQEEANVRQAEATLAYSQETAQRYNQVVSQGFVTQQEASQYQTQADKDRQALSAARQRAEAARAALQAARARYDLLQAQGRSEDIQIAQAGRQEAGGMIEQLQAQIAQSVVRAPDDGLVLERDVHLGQISSPSQTFFKLARDGKLELRAQIPQADLARVQENVRGTFDFGVGQTGGRVWQIEPQLDPESRLGTARIVLAPNKALKVGMFAQGSLDLGKSRTLVIPLQALQGEGDDRYVFVLDDKNRAQRKHVTIGLQTSSLVEVLDGLQPEQVVVSRGASFLADGERVRRSGQ